MSRDFQLPGRSPVIACEGMAATSHPLATLAAVDMLREGGTAADAAVAACATLCVVEPHMTGIGGDCYALVSKPDKPVWGYNGSGRSGAKASYIEGGLGRIEGITADRAFSNASAKGLFPLSFTVVDIDQEGPVATANVTATAANGATASQPVEFIAGPSPTGWQVTKSSALSLLSAAS